MSFSGGTTKFVVAPLLLLTAIYACLWPPEPSTASYRPHSSTRTVQTAIVPKDELQAALEGVSMENRTLIIAVLNKAYVEENGILDLFLQSFHEEEDTKLLIKHILFVAVDQRAFNRCSSLELHCYKLITEGVDFSEEAFYMSDKFNDMMWRRTLFLGDVLRRGYNFIFTDMDVLWLRNPFSKLNHDDEDLLMSCDFYFGDPSDNNQSNTGFYYVTANSKTVALFDEWHALRTYSKDMKDQDVLHMMIDEGIFMQLGLKVRFLETTYFSGFCEMSQEHSNAITVHSNCCVTMKAKITDLREVLRVWRMIKGNQTSDSTWPPKTGMCLHDTTIRY